MFILGNLIIGVTHVLDAVLSLFTLVIVASAIISFTSISPRNKFVLAVNALTFPVFGKLRKMLPSKYWLYGQADLIPLYTILIIILIQRGILPSLYQIGFKLVG
ncbi:MAG: YggT family protein [Alphaproteobacteria bacterium]|nr:YggT family protein [Alphaproteobacteria bacterium]